MDFEIDVYESKDYIGGRELSCLPLHETFPLIYFIGSTVVYPYDNSSLPELELGASIFVQANKNLWRASDEFNLTRRDFREQDYESGIWDGQNMLFSVRSRVSVSRQTSINIKSAPFSFSSTADGGIQPKCYGDMASHHPNEPNHCTKKYLSKFFKKKLILQEQCAKHHQKVLVILY